MSAEDDQLKVNDASRFCSGDSLSLQLQILQILWWHSGLWVNLRSWWRCISECFYAFLVVSPQAAALFIRSWQHLCRQIFNCNTPESCSTAAGAPSIFLRRRSQGLSTCKTPTVWTYLRYSTFLVLQVGPGTPCYTLPPAGDDYFLRWIWRPWSFFVCSIFDCWHCLIMFGLCNLKCTVVFEYSSHALSRSPGFEWPINWHTAWRWKSMPRKWSTWYSPSPWFSRIMFIYVTGTVHDGQSGPAKQGSSWMKSCLDWLHLWRKVRYSIILQNTTIYSTTPLTYTQEVTVGSWAHDSTSRHDLRSRKSQYSFSACHTSVVGTKIMLFFFKWGSLLQVETKQSGVRQTTNHS